MAKGKITLTDSTLMNFGATATQLAQIFDVTQKKVTQRLAGRAQTMTVEGDPTPRWRIRDAAPYLVAPKIDVEEFLRTLSPAKLPPKLQDAFWSAQDRRMTVEERMGELWSTQRVMEVYAEAFKPMRMAILMFKDTVGQQVELTARQRTIILEESDKLMAMLRDGLMEKFKDYVPPDDEHGRPLDEIANAAEQSVETKPEEEYDDGFGAD